jgi:hypothetical protein
MLMSTLTPKQKKLVHELEQISDILSLNYQNVVKEDEQWRTTHLEKIKRHIIIGEVITSYTLVDELLNMIICRFFFGRRRSFPQLWKTKRFQLFNQYVIESLYLPQKLRLVKEIQSIPKAIIRDIERLCALRDGLAHAFFPENLRSSKPVYKGIDIFSFEGISLLCEDMQNVYDYLIDLKD